ncbi:MAG: RHS repeat domain-containing protein [Caulobacteraceae bacterium]
MALVGTARAGTVSYTYDELGRVKTVSYADGTVVSYTYDAAGNRTAYTVGGPDVTPNAVNWTNISGGSGATNSAVTLNGITAEISLTITYTGSGSISYSKNGGSFASVTSGGEIAITDGNTLVFKASGNSSGTVTVRNASDGASLIDTFDYAVTADVTPNSVDWANITDADGATNAAVTFAGIDASISLTVTYTGTAALLYSKNSGSYASIPSAGSVAISNGDTLRFKATSSSSASGTVTVVNSTDGGATLDSFTYSISGADVTPNALNWTNISTSGFVSAGANTNSQSIGGISAPITLRIEIEDFGTWGNSYFDAVKNSTPLGGIAGGQTFSVTSGDAVYFTAYLESEYGGGASYEVKVYNDSDGGALLDSFTVAISVTGI